MKKTLSIVMLVVFLFNVGGYYLAFLALDFKANRDLNARLDNNLYAASETIELKIPVTLPYPIQDRDFERVDGRFEYQGEYFKMVKHKLDQDTLYIVCIRNQEHKQLVTTITDYVKLSSDLPATSKKAMTLLGKLLKDFDRSSRIISIPGSTWERTITFAEPGSVARVAPGDIPYPPPRA